MGKKVTSFLVILAAVLLSLPTQAQVARKAAKTQMKTSRASLVDKQVLRKAEAAKMKAAEAPFYAEVKAEDAISAEKARKEADTTVGKSFAKWNWAAHATPKFIPQAKMVAKGKLVETHKTRVSLNAFDGKQAGVKRAPTTNTYGIITAPDEGEEKFYTRAGTAYYASGNQVYSADQSGNVTIVEAADGTVYIKDIVSRYTQGTWVKGTKEGNTITVAAGQPLAYNTTYSATLSVNWGNYDESTENGWNKEAGDITFTVDEEAKTISLVGSNENLYIGIFWDDDNSFAGYGDYDTVWTLDEDYVPPSEELVELPEGAEVQTWYREQTNSTSTGETNVTGTDVKVAFVGSDVYVAGIFTAFPEAWIKGSIEGTTVTFAGEQFIGYYGGSTPIWAFGTDGSALEDFTMTYDVDAQTLTSVNQLLGNAAADRIYYLQWISSLTLYAEEPAPTQIDVLPYSNDFSTAELLKHFKAIDANGDGNTWGAGTENFTISYATPNDDWLVSPAIKLVAGKKYHFAVDAWARSAGYPETFEIKAAAEATAEALAAGITVIDQQTISNTAAQTFETEEFSVEETGYYFIGIHNTSDDQWEQYVDNFLIEALPISAPYTADFTQAGTIDDFFTLDANGDNNTWTWSAANGAYYSYSSTNNGDDYLILPIKLEATKNYNIVVTASAASTSFPEKFEVKVGKEATVEGLSFTAIAETTINTNVDTEYEGSFTSDEAGTYYVAIHATSDADMWRLNVKKVVIEAGAEGNAPAAVTDLDVVPGADGALFADINFTTPTTAVNGTALTGEVEAKIYRDNELINTQTVSAGGSVTYQDTNLADGTTYTYYVVVANESGDGQKSEKVSVYVGQDTPADVENFVANATPSNIIFTWDEATGVNGGYINTAEMQYKVWSLAVEAGFFGNYLVEDEVLATTTGETTATIDYDTMSGELEYKYFGVSAANAVGETDPTVSYDYVLVGAPYELPIEESFTGSKLHYVWDTNGGLGVDSNASDGDDVALKLYNDGTSADVFFLLPKVNLASAANPTIIFDACAGVNVDKVQVIGAVEGGEFVVLGEANLTADYTTFKVNLSEVKNGAFAAVGFLANIPTESVSQYEDYFLLDNIKVMDLLSDNLVADITAPKNVTAGKEVPVKITVRNMGENEAEGYTVKLFAGEEELQLEGETTAIPQFETVEFNGTFAPDIFFEAGTVTLRAEVVYEVDLDEDDNVAETDIEVKEPTAIAPESLTATPDGQKALLEWTVSESVLEAVTDDFSAYENGADEDGELGDWTLVNANGYTKGGIFEDLSLASDGLPNAWQVFNLVTYGGDNSAFAGPDGVVDNNYLVSIYNLQDDGYPGNDDWLISPELPGVAQTLSFDVKAFNDYGAQTYQVLYSTTDKNLESFTLIEEVEDNGNEWNNVSYELPEGTKYFAIRNITGGDEGFILAVDNIVFLMGGGEISAFNIYVDEVLVGSVDGGVLTYTTDVLPEGEHKVSVTALYGENESRPVDAFVTISAPTAIDQIINVDKLVDIFTVDGKLVRHNANSVKDLKPGVYVIDNQKVTVK